VSTKFPLISVIVPNYNHEKYLKQRLDSIFNQTYQNFEVIILDDCSTDNSRNILIEAAKNPKVTHLVFNEKNTKNTFTQWSKGISLAKGEYIWIAESDDFCDSDFIEMVIRPLLKNSNTTLSFCQSHRVNQHGEITGNWISHTDSLTPDFFSKDFVMDGNAFIEKFLIFKNVIPNASAVLFRKSIKLEKYLQIAYELRYCGDWIFYTKVISNNKIAFITNSYNSFRYHDTSVIATAVQERSRIDIIDIDFNMRAEIIQFLRRKKISNERNVILKNNQIVKSLKYEQSLLLIKNNQKLKGFTVLISVFDEFLKKYKFRKNLMIKLKRLIS